MQKKVLVVDDEPHIVKAIRFYLEDEDFEVLTATEGGEALELAEKHQPDLIILDVMMPCMDGFEVCRELRLRSRTRLIPVILLTARESVEDKVRGFELGADDYVTKPFNNRELLARVKSRIRRSEAELSSHPLTGLPGANLLEKEVNERLQSGQPFWAVFFVVDDYDHYRRAYGLQQGRLFLRFVAQLLDRLMRDAAGPGDFLAQPIEDEFVLLTRRGDVPESCRGLLEQFEQGRDSFLPQAALAQGEIVYYDFKGNAVHSPLPRLLAACLSTGSRFLASYSALSAWAAQAVMQARAQKGTGLVVEE
jgi:PleD family two-component response regulator